MHFYKQPVTAVMQSSMHVVEGSAFRMISYFLILRKLNLADTTRIIILVPFKNALPSEIIKNMLTSIWMQNKPCWF